MRRLLSLLAALGVVAAAQSFSPGPLSRSALRQAAAAAGFRVISLSVDAPTAVRPRFAYTTFEYDDPLLENLRSEFKLEDVVKGAPDEWTAQLKLKDWVFRQIPGGMPKTSPKNAAEILRLAAQGNKFYCTHYAMTYIECAQALGWQTRKLSVDRLHGPEGMTSAHHGVTEVWSNQFRKWIVIDPQSNLHFEKAGIPLSGWEIREEWLTNKGKDVDHVVGAPPDTTKRNPAMVWHVPDDDEIAVYFWIAIDDNARPGASPKRLFPQDRWNAGRVWYQNDSATKRGRMHVGYATNAFLPTSGYDEANWTVCIVETKLTGAAPGIVRMALDSYCPNRTAFEVSTDGVAWQNTVENSIAWSLKPGWNMLRLRTVGRGNVLGPETAAVMYLSPLETPK